MRVWMVMFGLLGALTAAAAPPSAMRWQGQILDAAGIALTGTYTLGFELFDGAGTSRWSETQPGIAVEGGYAAVDLGAVVPFPGALFDGDALSLEVRVNNVVMGPRTPLRAVPFARTAVNVRGGSVVATDVSASGQLMDATGFASPPGMMSMFAGAAAPQGWLMADGALVSRTTYARLFAAIGITYGAGDGSTTFQLPDLRGIFPRGAGTNGSVPGQSASLGAYAGDQLRDHTHYAGRPAVMYENGSQWLVNDRSLDMLVGSDCWSCGAANPVTVPAGVTAGAGSETHPANVGVNYILKY